ncbi:hypothetical protein BC835DRAFT_1067677 [Cytidiella melzeri]|nr:hypothetical protein BC835DRAFT_1067677 [Cytidiella melzeri]
MASAAAPPVQTGGVSASIWANQPMPPRSGRGKGPESSSKPRGATRGTFRGSGRGGRGGTIGRPANGKGSAPATESDSKKATVEPSKEQVSSTIAAPPAAITPSLSQTSTITKASHQSKHSRKNSEQRLPRKQPSLGVDTLNVKPSNASSSPSTSISPRTPSRRKRPQANKTAPPPPPAVPVTHARKQSVASEQDSTRAEVHVAQPAAVPVKDLPPHMAAPQENSAPSDIAHSIDALVERVRTVAMDRPHTPGTHSHFDWAEDDEDDSLPDLDDWGVTSSLSTTDPVTDVADSEKVGVNVISPILQDTLRPLPNITDIDASTPSIKVHEAQEHETKPRTDAEDGTPRNAAYSVMAKAPAHMEGDAQVESLENAAPETEPQTSPSPDRGLASSIHAMSPLHSVPTSLHPRFPNPPRGGFIPSHNRAHTLGRIKPDSPLDSDRPQRHDVISHGRNHSTPHTGPGTAIAHARAPHHTRPVISGDAISRLARSLGGASVPRREREAAPATASSVE